MKNNQKLITMALATTLSLSNIFGHGINPHLKQCPVLCPVNPMDARNDCCYNYHVDIGLIYQQPYLPGMNAGQEYVEIHDGNPVDPDYYHDQLTVLEECFDYALGVTASLGYLLKHDDWYLGARFNYLHSSVNSNYNNTELSTHHLLINLPYIGLSGSTALNEYAEAFDELNGEEFNRVVYSASINIYLLDILISRGSFHSKFFSYEPFTGVKALWFDSNDSSQMFASNDTGHLIIKQDNWGAGPMFGFNGEYHFFDGLAIFSDSDVALLFGESNLSTEAQQEDLDGGLVDDQYRSTRYENIGCMIYVPVRSILGLKFSKYCFEDRHYLALKIGYDVQAVIGLEDLYRGFTMSGLYTNLVWNF